MDSKVLVSTIGVAICTAYGTQGAVLQTDPGATISGDVTIIDTGNDAGDWIDSYGDASDATLYYGFDFTVDNDAGETGTGGLFAALQFDEGGSERLGVGNNWQSVNLSTFGFGGDQDLAGPTPYVVGETYRIVVRIDYNSGGDDSAAVWIDPASEASVSTDLGTDNATFDTIRLRAGNDPGQVTFGNIVFATTFAEAVVPEPGSLALLGLGGLFMLRRRRGA